jgi:hypothetical protein
MNGENTFNTPMKPLESRLAMWRHVSVLRRSQVITARLTLAAIRRASRPGADAEIWRSILTGSSLRMGPIRSLV